MAVYRLIFFWLAVAGADASGLAQQQLVIPPTADVVALPAGTPAKAVQLTKLLFSIPEGTGIGPLKAGANCARRMTIPWSVNAVEGSEASFEAAFGHELKAAGFSVVERASDMFNSEDAAPDYELGANIVQVAADFCTPDIDQRDARTIKGSVLMMVEWQLFDRRDRKIVARYTSRAGIESPITRPWGMNGMLVYGFGQNVRALIASGVLQPILVGAPTQAADADAARAPAKGLAPIIVKAPVATAVKRLPDAIGATVLILTANGLGSGGLISADGYFLTNYHVVGTEKYVKIRWSDGVEGAGEVIRRDRGRDVALIKGDGRGRSPFRLRAGRPPVGTTIFAIGTPLDASLQNSVTKGIISATRIQDGYALYQSDVSVQHGNSGGPVIDENSQLVALVVAGLEKDGMARGINFLIPAAEAYDFLGVKTAP